MNIYKNIGWLGTLLFSLRMIPQILHTYHSTSVKDLSLSFILLDFFSAICLFIYSVTIKAYPMIISNLMSTICDFLLLILYFYKTHKYKYIHKNNNE